MLQEALAYLDRGWPIFPVCTPIPEKPGWCVQHGDHAAANAKRGAEGKAALAKPGKHPLVSWAWLQKELPDEDNVREWWGKWPEANIGLATGALSGVVVLDSDSMDALTAVLSNGGVEPTAMVVTGRPNGIHWYLKHPGYRVVNFASPLGHEGLDFRGDGGYAVLPPSLHESGQHYRWQGESTELSTVPPWLADLLGTGRTPSEPYRPSLKPDELVQGIDDGSRDDSLWRFACRMRADDLPLGYAELLIEQAATRSRPPFPTAEAISKVRRAYEQYQPTPRLHGQRVQAPPVQDTGEIKPDMLVNTAGDFLNKPIPEWSFIVPGYIGDESIVILYGATATLKTYVATDLALSVALGLPWCGWFDVQQGRVLIVEEDTPEAIYQQKYLRPMVEARKINPDDIGDSLYIAISNGFRLDDDARVHQLEQWLAEYRPRLVILDAFYLLHRQDSKDETALVPILQTLRGLRDTFHCTIVLIDHSRKSGSVKSLADPIDDLYGGQAKASSSDGLIQFLRVPGEKSMTFMAVRKVRGEILSDPIRLKLHDGLLTVDGQEEETEDGTERVVFDWLYRQGGTRTYQQISDGVNLSVRTVTRACAGLARKGRLVKGRQGHELTWLAGDFAKFEEEGDVNV